MYLVTNAGDHAGMKQVDGLGIDHDVLTIERCNVRIVPEHVAHITATVIARVQKEPFPPCGPLLVTVVNYDTIGCIPRRCRRKVINPVGKFIDLDIDNLIQLYRDGVTPEELASRFGVSRTTVRRRLERLGVTVRGRAEMARIVPTRRSPESVANIVAALVGRTRGVPWTQERGERRARTRQERRTNAGPGDLILEEWLADAGIATVLQKAIGPYNCDLAADSIAVEILGGNWHGSGEHLVRYPDRCRYILNLGWNMLLIWNNAYSPMVPSVTKYVISMLEETRSDPSVRGEYRVVRGNGEEMSRGKGEFNNRTLIPPTKRRIG